MKNFKRMFRDAERLHPTEALWRKIESDVAMERPIPESAFASTYYKLAAAVVLGAGLLTAGLFMQNRPGGIAGVKASVTAPKAEAAGGASGKPVTYEVDSDLLVWAADLGELDLDAEESAEEVL